MISRGEKPDKCFLIVMSILPLVLLCGCASTPPIAAAPVVEERPIDGGGMVGPGTVGGVTAADRTTVNSSNQQIFNTEHSGDPGAPMINTSTQAGGIP